MVQVTPASELCSFDMHPVVDHGRARLASLPDGSGRMPRIRQFSRPPTPLDFLRVLRIKTLRKFMERSFLKLLHGVLSIGLVLFVTGCGEDPRFSGNTQYVGGVYGGEQGGGGPPRDTVSYWDGDHASGSPSIKISLGEQRAYFYKGGVLVGVSQLSTGREGLNTPAGNYKIIQKDKDHVSSLFGDYVDSSGKVVVANIDIKKIRNRQAHTSKARRCRTLCASCRGQDCTPVICRAIRHRTAVSGCLNSWLKISSDPCQSERR